MPDLVCRQRPSGFCMTFRFSFLLAPTFSIALLYLAFLRSKLRGSFFAGACPHFSVFPLPDFRCFVTLLFVGATPLSVCECRFFFFLCVSFSAFFPSVLLPFPSCACGEGEEIDFSPVLIFQAAPISSRLFSLPPFDFPSKVSDFLMRFFFRGVEIMFSAFYCTELTLFDSPSSFRRVSNGVESSVCLALQLYTGRAGNFFGTFFGSMRLARLFSRDFFRLFLMALFFFLNEPHLVSPPLRVAIQRFFFHL